MMHKKIFPVIFLVLLLLAGIIALTQEAGSFNPGPAAEADEGAEDGEDFFHEYELAEDFFEIVPKEIPEWVRPPRWFRSNSGGMALEEIPSRLAAMRNEYALVVDYTGPEELPAYLSQYFNDEYFIEIRTFYKNGEKVRMQWIFRDFSGTTRFLAVFIETEDESLSGFIEFYNEDSFLASELKFWEDGKRDRTDYFYSDEKITHASAWQWEENDDAMDHKKIYTDYYRYNRSWFLRAVERVFHEEQQINTTDDSVRIAFPNRIMEAARSVRFVDEKLNVNPEFFPETVVKPDSRIVYAADERGRILTQTLIDEEDNVVWVIKNTWEKDRIVSISRIEGGTELVTEYEYDREGNRIVERNFRGGILERLVRTEDKLDIEELYMNERVVLRAVWEDGRKVSEARVGRN